MNDLDRILAELVEIAERARVAASAVEKLDLEERRDELHRMARRVVPVSHGELRHQLERLVAAWERLQRQRIDVVKQAGDLAAGNFGFTSDAVRLNRKIDEAAGRADLERRIAELRSRLDELEVGRG